MIFRNLTLLSIIHSKEPDKLFDSFLNALEPEKTALADELGDMARLSSLKNSRNGGFIL